MSNNTQLTHEDHKPSNITLPLNIIANDINSPQNVGSLFRLCDALAIDKLFLCGNTAVPPNKKIKKTSRSTEKHVSFEQHINTAELVVSLKESGGFIIALEISSASMPIDSLEFNNKIKTKIKDKIPIYLNFGLRELGSK